MNDEVLVPSILAAFVAGCPEGGGSGSEPTKRLYQTGCQSDRDCEEGGVCRDEGSETICYPPCRASTCTTPEGTAGTCEERACVPSCAGATCPSDLSCVADRCVPFGTVPSPRYQGTWAGMSVASVDRSACGGSPTATESSTIAFDVTQTGNSVTVGIPGERAVAFTGTVDGDSATWDWVPDPLEQGPDCPSGGAAFTAACLVGEDARAQPLGIGMFCFAHGDLCGCPGGAPGSLQFFLSKQR